MTSRTVMAAGCLITRVSSGDTEVLLVHRPKYDDWSLPKGKQEGGEHLTQTATREVLEEAGVLVALKQPLPGRSYTVGGQPKSVQYWRAEVQTDKGFAPNREVDEIAWLPVDSAVSRVTHPLDAELVTRAHERAATPFLLLRHGHATKRVAWSGTDDERPLDASGVAQSDALVPRLSVYGLSRVHSSAARRCIQTVSPYADARGLPVVTEPLLTEHAAAEAPEAAKARVAGLIAAAARGGEPSLLCGHRPYLPDLVDHLLEGSGLTGPHATVPVASMIVLHCSPGEDNHQVLVLALEHHRL